MTTTHFKKASGLSQLAVEVRTRLFQCQHNYFFSTVTMQNNKNIITLQKNSLSTLITSAITATKCFQ